MASSRHERHFLERSLLQLLPQAQKLPRFLPRVAGKLSHPVHLRAHLNLSEELHEDRVLTEVSLPPPVLGGVLIVPAELLDEVLEV